MNSQLHEVSRGLRKEMPRITEEVNRLVRDAFPDVRFTDLWVRPRRSWYGDEVVEIWAIYEGEVANLDRENAREGLSLGVRVQQALWDRGLDASPSTHFITKSDAGDWRPEGL